MKYSYQPIITRSLLILNLLCLFSCSGSTDKSVEKNNNTGKIIAPAFTVINNKTVDISKYPKDNEGFVNLFDGKTFNGWRGYGKDHVPNLWSIEDGIMRYHAGHGNEGGNIIFACKFKNFELELEWKIAKGGNSGIFYLAKEIQTQNPETGEFVMQPIYASAPEYQLLDNENSPYTEMNKHNRLAGSLYDMIPASPQNVKPFGNWNKAKIRVNNGNVIHSQNGEKVLEYQLWTPEWTTLLQTGKFGRNRWPLAFELLNNCGGKEKEGYIGLQDMGYDVWFRNIRIKVLD